MLKLKISDYDIEFDDSFPSYYDATDEQLESALYDSDCWDDETGMIDGTKYYCILTFDDIKADFESWTPEDRKEYLGEDDTDDYDVHNWIRDCMMNSLSVIKSIHKKGE